MEDGDLPVIGPKAPQNIIIHNYPQKGNEPPAPVKNNNKWLLVGIGILLILGIVGYFYLKGKETDEHENNKPEG